MSGYVVNSVRSDASMSKVCGLEIRKPSLGSTIDVARRKTVSARIAHDTRHKIEEQRYRRIDERAGQRAWAATTDGRRASLATLNDGLLPDRPSSAHLSLERAGGRSESGNT